VLELGPVRTGYEAREARPSARGDTPPKERTNAMRTSLLSIVYLIVGVFVAASHHYFAHVDTIRLVVSALLAVLLWPLLLVGINLHVK
jgi:hypothetical protein